MTGMHLTYTFHVQGSPANDEAEFIFRLPVDATLVHVSAVASNATDATMDVGIEGGDTNGILQGFAIGASSTPTVADKGDFNGALVTDDFYRFTKSDKIRVYLEGTAGSTAMDDPTIVLSFLEG